MRIRATSHSAAVAIVAAVVGIAGTQTRQIRDVSGQGTKVLLSTGTAELSGNVLTDTVIQRPVSRALIRLDGSTGTGGRTTITDAGGRFAFGALPPDHYSLTATKTGYVPLFYGSRHPGRGPGIPIAIADGQRIEVALKVLPGAVITGTVTDAHGNSGSGLQVLAVEVPLDAAHAAARVSARATTDDRGIYRIFGLASGNYVVSVWPHSVAGSRSNGPSTEIVPVADDEVQWARNLSTANPRALLGTPMPPAGHPVSYVPLFFPGTTDADAAALIALEPGDERPGVDFSLRTATTARLVGRLVNQNGEAISGASMLLYPRRSTQGSTSQALISSGILVLPRPVVSAAGFSIAGVAPGEYTLVARTGSAGRAAAAQPAMQSPLWNVTDLTVDGRDQTDLVLRLEPGIKVSGSITFEGSSSSVPADLSHMDLSMSETSSLVGGPATPRAVVDSVGAFRFDSVFPGAYALKVTPPRVGPGTARWTLKSALLDGRDLADVPLVIAPGHNVNGLLITFSGRETEISGALTDPDGKPVSRYSILVFTVNPSLWLPNARRVRSTTPATDGTFKVTGLPVGDYAIAAAENLEASDLADAAFLSGALASAYRLTLTEGEKKTQNLRTTR